jgi:hypothetical protein
MERGNEDLRMSMGLAWRDLLSVWLIRSFGLVCKLRRLFKLLETGRKCLFEAVCLSLEASMVIRVIVNQQQMSVSYSNFEVMHLLITSTSQTTSDPSKSTPIIQSQRLNLTIILSKSNQRQLNLLHQMALFQPP